MKRILLFDVESTSLSPNDGDCIELAAVVFSLEHMCVVKAYSTVLRTGKPNPIENINHIPGGVLDDGTAPAQAWASMETWSKSCDYVVGHYCEFDKQWVPQACSSLLAKQWIDTGNCTWPRQAKPGENLVALCLNHGVGVVDPHRALNDCLLLAMLLRRVHELGHDVQAILAQDLRPKAVFEAMVSYEDREQAKAAGFHWEDRKWTRRMAIEDAERLPFPVREVRA